MDDRSLDFFIDLDDTDIWAAIKEWQHHPDFVLSQLSRDLINRHLFKIEMTAEPPSDERIKADQQRIASYFGIPLEQAAYLLSFSSVSTNMYSFADDSIDILFNDGRILPITTASDMLNLELLSKKVSKFAYCQIRLP
jgi:hypothetical protein